MMASPVQSSRQAAEAVGGVDRSYAMTEQNEISFWANEREDADHLVLLHHYSRRVPANIQWCGVAYGKGGLFGNKGNPLAAIFFSIPPTRWAEEVWELSRLVRVPDSCFPLTRLVSWACKAVRTISPGLLVSFADSTHKHHGGIYQAASWHYHGKRDSNMDGLVVNGEFVPGRSCNSAWGTRSPCKLKEIFPSYEIEPHYDEGKHLYWRSLNREGQRKAERLGLVSSPYPKPGRQGTDLCTLIEADLPRTP